MQSPRPRLRDRIALFFMGRNGPDTLYYFFFALSLIAIFLNGILRYHPVLRVVLPILYALFFGLALFRLLSRNIAKRRKENAAFRRFFGWLFRPFYRLYLRLRDRRTHVYRKCPHCKSMLRLRRIPGEHVARCPACHDTFTVKVKG